MKIIYQDNDPIIKKLSNHHICDLDPCIRDLNTHIRDLNPQTPVNIGMQKTQESRMKSDRMSNIIPFIRDTKPCPHQSTGIVF